MRKGPFQVTAMFAVFVIMLTSLADVEESKAQGRDVIRIVGSSTVFPFSALVAEWYSKKTNVKAPVVESTGTGGGFKIFCSGAGINTPDIVNASRPIKDSEVEACQANGVTPIEVVFGYDGIAIAVHRDGERLEVTRQQLFLALAKQVPIDGELVDNPHRRWREIDVNFPDIPIRVYGPPPTSGTRDAFAELVLQEGARSFPLLLDLSRRDKRRYEAIAHAVREDGAYIEAGENDNLITQKLQADPGSYGIFGFSYYEQNSDRLSALTIDNVEPSFDSIADGGYVVSRELFFYLKKEHLDTVQGLRAYAEEFLTEDAIGDFGYLSEKGLVPLPESERVRLRDAILNELG